MEYFNVTKYVANSELYNAWHAIAMAEKWFIDQNHVQHKKN